VIDLKDGDRILLCSDGLTNLVQDQEIHEIVTRYPLKEACENLVKLANERGGDDNITVVLAQAVENT
jgi:serine/threonine protein phosphatase PrpC